MKNASPEQAAAIVAAIERFMRATAPEPTAHEAYSPDPWVRAAMLEGVEREDPGVEVSGPWINT